MLREIFSAALKGISNAFKPQTIPALPEAVTAGLLKRGYRQDLNFILYPMGGASGLLQLQAPGGAYIGDPQTSQAIIEKYIADAKEVYTQCGLPVPAVIPGTEQYAPVPAPKAPHA